MSTAAIRSGATIEPIPIVATQRPWTAPKARASTSSGTARVPEPDDGKEQERNEGVGKDADQADRDAPQDDSDEEIGRQAPSDQQRRDERADQSSDPHRRVEEPDSVLPQIEQLERGDDDQDVERSGDERLRGEQRHQDAKPGLAEDRGEAGRELVPDGVSPLAGLGLRLDPDAADQ
jgi:hypothetical protein